MAVKQRVLALACVLGAILPSQVHGQNGTDPATMIVEALLGPWFDHAWRRWEEAVSVDSLDWAGIRAAALEDSLRARVAAVWRSSLPSDRITAMATYLAEGAGRDSLRAYYTLGEEGAFLLAGSHFREMSNLRKGIAEGLLGESPPEVRDALRRVLTDTMLRISRWRGGTIAHADSLVALRAPGVASGLGPVELAPPPIYSPAPEKPKEAKPGEEFLVAANTWDVAPTVVHKENADLGAREFWGSKCHIVVFIQVLIDESGHVVKTRAVGSKDYRGVCAEGRLRSAAREAARHWTFTPARRSGVAVKCTFIIPFEFSIYE